MTESLATILDKAKCVRARKLIAWALLINFIVEEDAHDFAQARLRYTLKNRRLLPLNKDND